MSLDHILLGMLRRPATGYDLGREFRQGAQHFWYAERSQIYPTLKRLQKQGWLRRWNEPSERGPQRRVYETTEAGRKELRRWLLDGAQIGRDRLPYLAQVFFLGELDDLHGSLRVVQEMQARWGEKLMRLESFERGALYPSGEDRPPGTEDFHAYAALRLGLHQLRAKLAWCGETLDKLRARLAEAEPEAVTERVAARAADPPER